MESNTPKQVKYDVEFQKAIMHIMLKDYTFASRTVSYFDKFEKENKEDKRKSAFVFFTNPDLNIIYSVVSMSINKYHATPEPGVVRNHIKQNYSETEALSAIKVYEAISKMTVGMEDYYRSELESYITAIISLNTQVNVLDSWDKDVNSAYKHWKQSIAEIDKINLGKKTFKTMSQIWDVLESETNLFIPSFMPEFDDDKVLGGGFPRGDLSVVVGGSNSGKTMFMVDWARHCILAGYKVYYVALDSRKGEIIRRLMASMTGIPTRKIKKDKLSPAEKEMIRQWQEKYEHLIRINEDIAYPASVEEFVVHARHVHSDWKPDAFIVDYLTKMTTKKFTRDKRHEYGEIANYLRSLAKETDTVVMSPVQPTRESQKIMNGTSSGGRSTKPEDYYMKMTDIAEAQEIANVAGSVITINATDEEQRIGKRRLMVVKNREGEKNFPIGIITDLGCCRILSGERFNPNDVAIDIEPIDTVAEANATKASGKTESTKEKDDLRKVDAEILKIRGEIPKLEDIYNYSRFNGTPAELEVSKANLDAALKQRYMMLEKAKGLSHLVFGHVSKASLDLQKEQIDVMKKERLDKKKIQQAETVLRLQKYGSYVSE